MGVVAGPLAVAGFVMPANRAMETIEVPTAHTAPHAELGPAPPTGKRGAAATADSLFARYSCVLLKFQFLYTLPQTPPAWPILYKALILLR